VVVGGWGKKLLEEAGMKINPNWFEMNSADLIRCTSIGYLFESLQL